MLNWSHHDTVFPLFQPESLLLSCLQSHLHTMNPRSLLPASQYAPHQYGDAAIRSHTGVGDTGPLLI